VCLVSKRLLHGGLPACLGRDVTGPGGGGGGEASAVRGRRDDDTISAE